MDTASPEIEQTYTWLWLDACFRQMRAERCRSGWLSAAEAWRSVMRMARELGSAQDERVFRQLAEEALIRAIVEDEMNKGAARPSDGT